jgi:acetyltransferase EpsM
MKKIVLLGATGGCVDILDTILDINRTAPQAVFDIVGFLDDRAEMKGTKVLGAAVLGPFKSVQQFHDCLFVTGIGSATNYWRREAIISALGIPLERFATVVHPSASISSSATLGYGTVVHQHATVTTGARVGNHVLILPQAVISHGDVVGDFSIINAGVCLASDVVVEKGCYLGARSTVRQDIKIGARAQLGMGSVVIKDVPPETVVVGNPARFLRKISDSLP